MSSIENETGRLIARVRAGDRAAEDALFRLVGPRLAQVAALRLGWRLRDLLLEHEDLLQDTLLEGFRDLEAFEDRGSGSFLHWMAGILENRIRNSARAQDRRKRGGGRPVVRLSDLGADSCELVLAAVGQTTPSQAARREELRERIEAAILSLPQDMRRVVELRKFCGSSYARICDELELGSEDSARKLLSRALARVAKNL